MGCKFHPCQGIDLLAVTGAESTLGGELLDEWQHDGATGQRRSDDDHWRRGKSVPLPLLHQSDPGQSVRQLEPPAVTGRSGHQMQHEPQGGLLGQCSHVEPSFDAEYRAGHHRQQATRDEVRANVFDYIERFYNARRRHSPLNRTSPVEFEKRHAGLTGFP